MLASLRRLSSDVALELLTDSNLQAATALAVTAIKSTAETAIEASVDRSSIATVLGGALTKLSSLREAISSEDVDAVSALAE
ncbi:hypothetical protein [uncultured Cohaesibacter sp.]|uniref:hypothetical protein n=1 Tax=uncultured Cohaesibacter sp. TaxID=1002546 RepID=UPI0029C608D5|nr:hypothetical protein [uncultured Cohaesibacter sp.]